MGSEMRELKLELEMRGEGGKVDVSWAGKDRHLSGVTRLVATPGAQLAA